MGKNKPKVNTEKIAELCMDGTNEEGLKVAATVTFGQQFVDASLSPEGCFEGKKLKETQLADLDDIVECCVQSVIGEIKQDNMGGSSGGSAIESLQKCANDLDCYSGSCAITQNSGNNGNSGNTGGSTGGSTGGNSGGGSTLKCFTS